MKSFVDIERTFSGQPARLGPLLQRVDVGRGREELFRDQMPELLSSLAESARVSSIRASNAIEGVEVNQDRAERLAGGARFRNRGEREFAGYRDAIDELVRMDPEPVSVGLLLHLHRQIFRHVDGAGGTFKGDDNLIVSYESGRREVIFEPVSRSETPIMTKELIERYLNAQNPSSAKEPVAHPLILIAAFILDVLAIHPVADGNGRVARLLTTHQLLNHGYGVARYVSVEQQIFETKNSYYASLAESQRGWHTSEHTIWPWVEYLIGTLATTYDIFEARVAAVRGDMAGNKQERVRNYVLRQAPAKFKIADVRRAVPGISDPTIRIVLNDLREAGRITTHGSGRSAVWNRIVDDRGDRHETAAAVTEPRVTAAPTGNGANDRKARRAWIIERLNSGTGVTRADVVQEFQVSEDTATRDLRELRDEGMIAFVGPPKGGAWQLTGTGGATAS